MAVKKTVAKKAVETEAVENVAMSAPEAEAPKKSYRAKRTLDPHMYVTVRNGFAGTLVYRSRSTRERYVWDGFGAEQDIELQELKSARNASKEFFENNWFLIDDPEVIAWLGVERCYKNALNFEEFDELFALSPEEITARVALLSSGQKLSLAYRAKEKIESGELDSIKAITALEKALGTELIER